MIRFLLSSALLLLASSSICFADKKKALTEDDRNVITAIDLKKNTIEITHMSHGIKTEYFLSPDVIVVLGKKDGAAKDLKVGLATKGITLGTETEDPATIDEIDIQ